MEKKEKEWKGKDRKGFESKGKDWRGKEKKEKEWKGKDRKGKERNELERKGEENLRGHKTFLFLVKIMKCFPSAAVAS